MNQNQNQNENQNQNDAAAVAAAAAGIDNYERVIAEMDALDDRVAELHTNENIRNRFRERLALINNTDGYYTGDRVIHCRSIQMYDPEDWIALFGREQPVPTYVERCMRYDQDDTGTVPYAGAAEVSLLLEENVNPLQAGVHRAVFMVYITPHQQFSDGHIIEMEFGEGSNTHQTINRLFNTDIDAGGVSAIAEHFTEYQLLAFLADDRDVISLLYGYFLDGFNPMQFHGNYRIHECCNIVNVVLHDGFDPAAAPLIAIPPPPPVNDFVAIYRDIYNDYNEYYPADVQNNINHFIPFQGVMYPDRG
jgi:hypothetical protein